MSPTWIDYERESEEIDEFLEKQKRRDKNGADNIRIKQNSSKQNLCGIETA